MTPPPSELPNQIPHWLSLYGSIAGLIAVILQIAFALFKLFKIGKLEAKLTRDVFFRISDWGESVFTHALFIARHDSIEVRRVYFSLQKTSPIKKFPLSVLWVGNKKEGTGPFAENNFFAKSEICFIAKDIPVNSVYLAVLDGYDSEIKSKTNDFILKMSELKVRYDDFTRSQDQQAGIQIANDFIDTTTQTHQFLIDKIQIEQGDYTLEMTVEYFSKMLFFKVHRSTKSSISFTVSPEARDLLKAHLRTTLEEAGKNYAFGHTNSFSYPEYSPLNIKET